MIELKPTRAENAGLAHSCFGLSRQEIQFALGSPGLNDTHRLVWLVLATLNTNDPDFAKQLSLQQFARMLNMRPLKLWRAIQELEAMGFINLLTPEYLAFSRKKKWSMLRNVLKNGRNILKKINHRLRLTFIPLSIST